MKHKYLQEEHHIFRDAFHKFLEKEAYPHYNDWEKEGMIPRSFWRSMGSKGFLCPMVDERYSGAGADFGYSVVINEELEKVGSSLIGIGLHNDIVVPYFTQYGTDEQKKRWLPKCVSGEYITAIAMTEPGAGSDLASIRTTARKEGNHYIVNGEKTFITNGIHADLVIVVCKTDTNMKPTHKGMSLLVLERGMEGFKRGKKLKKMGLHSQDTAELIFEDVKVPAVNLLGEDGKGFYYLMEKLQQERLIVAIAAKTAAEVMLHITKKYVQERKAFGKSISDFQTVQFRLAEMYTEIEIGRTFVDECIANHMEGEDIVTKVSMAKWWLTDLAKKVSAECIQLHGGYGYMEEYEIARRYRDIPVSTIYAGTNEIMKSIIARGMGL
ncbi:acyl-CoA dehydrogenase [Bacillus pseudomycoides]|uniref:Acyl-CoA dehydrogenase n=1 Tax=Bacillus pseudomycoides TaxID=64104 RepID=A0AA91ZUF2_9BACI|nr:MULTISPECIES: acyl-CoA dehydrogenase family protein [Bacillus]PEB51651.1 acyl-CoA dehydrogenase [Bacillus sp. AFS098217]PED83619.1 acyl-CoA dehydrogenase [Bacillus pseudomycoides]PEU12393.1 acyl-CoA dehydrogenase [Bacillus sp. AFS019443]PEU21753.1 acyl-CoA dehydrogenase [Bacillus sp. AFS014408]PFW62114.1 acyl-CoA dehydrogenase [Bacillus sp. AFS075034]